MKSKTSFFNTVLFKKNLTRFWPIWSLYLLILIFQMPVTLFKQALSITLYSSDSFTNLECLADVIRSGLAVLPICIFSLISAAVVFSYLYNSQSCYTMHVLPLKRRELFFTNYISGISFMVIPQIVAFLFSVIVCIVRNITHVEYLFAWLLFVLGMTFFLYTLSVFCCMLSGHLGGVFVFFIIAAFAFQCVRYFLNIIIGEVCYGITGYYTNNDFFYTNTDSIVSYLTPLFRLDSSISAELQTKSSVIIFHGKLTLLVYCIAALVLLLVCYMLYKRRQLETVGDIVAVPWLAPVFRWAAALFGGLCLGTIITEIIASGSKSYFKLLLSITALLTFVFFYLAEMLLSKSFKVFRKKQIPEFVICIAIMMAVLIGFKSDWFKIEEYVPKQEQIAAVKLNGSNPDASDIVVDDEDTIRQIIAMHKEIIHHKKDYLPYRYNSKPWKDYYEQDEAYNSSTDIGSEDDDLLPKATTGSAGSLTSSGVEDEYTVTSLSINYYLKDGSSVSRHYTIPVNKTLLADETSPAAMLANIQDNPEWYLKYNLCKNYKEASIRGGSIDLYDNEGNSRTATLSEEHANMIWEAYQKDAQEGHLCLSLNEPALTDQDRYYNTLNLYLYSENGFQSIFDQIPQQADQKTMMQRLLGTPHVSSSYSSNFSIDPNSTQSTTYTGTLSLNTHCTYTLHVIEELGITSDDARMITNSDYYHLMDMD